MLVLLLLLQLLLLWLLLLLEMLHLLLRGGVSGGCRPVCVAGRLPCAAAIWRR